MIDNSREYIICAAIWYQDGTEAPRGMIAQNIRTGVVIGQWRHGNCINVRATNIVWNQKVLDKLIDNNEEFLGGEKPCPGEHPPFRYVDGFLTSKGNFVDRWQAMKLAYEAGQVPKKVAFKTELNGTEISDEELMCTEPQCNRRNTRYHMMYSEDIY